MGSKSRIVASNQEPWMPSSSTWMSIARSEAPGRVPYETSEWMPPPRNEPEEGWGTVDAAECVAEEVSEEAKLAVPGADLVGTREPVHGYAIAVAGDELRDGDEEDT